jgi:hypothetical protein
MRFVRLFRPATAENCWGAVFYVVHADMLQAEEVYSLISFEEFDGQ